MPGARIRYGNGKGHTKWEELPAEVLPYAVPKYWNGNAFVPYPNIVARVARAMWEQYNDVLDRHVRPRAWEEACDPRSGLFLAAAAAIKVVRPEWALPKEPFRE